MNLTSVSSIDLPSPPTLILVSVSGTYAMQTNEFIDSSRSVHPLQDQAAVGAAEAEGVREHVVEPGLARRVGHVVEIALGIRVLVVDRRRNDAVVDGERADRRLEAPGGAEQVARHRLRRGNRELARVIAEDLLDREG